MLSLVPFKRSREVFGVPATDWVDRFFREMVPFGWREDGEWTPTFDVSETEGHVHVKADLPGVDLKDLDITIDNNVLTVRGEKKQEKEDKTENYHRVERVYGSFCRSFVLPSEVKAEDIDAVYKDGVLKLTVPKKETSQRKKIEVKH